MKVYVNGQLMPKADAAVSVFDHGLLYGDGVFEGIRAYDGLVFKVAEHIDRLFASAHTIMLQIPLTREECTAAIIATLQENALLDAYIRVVVTRGEGDLGLDPRKCEQPNVFMITDSISLYPEEYYRNGLRIITVPTRRNLPEALNPQLKSLNYLNNILAKIEATQAGCEEAIMLSWNGYVAECTGDNIFMVTGDQLLTPPTYLGILPGITRRAIMGLASDAGLQVQEAVLTRHDLYNADEVFLTGTAAEVIPVVEIDGRQVGDGAPGATSQRLMQLFRELTATDGVRYELSPAASSSAG